MTEGEFWKFIPEVRISAVDASSFIEELGRKLLRREPSEVLELRRHWFVVQERAYTWPVWDGACLLLDWIGDDSFMDFRAWLVTLGNWSGSYSIVPKDLKHDLWSARQAQELFNLPAHALVPSRRPPDNVLAHYYQQR